MRNGSLYSPVSLSTHEQDAVERLGSTPSSVRRSLKALNGSLVLQVQEAGKSLWKYKHPTIRDAFGAMIADDVDLLDIYLAGAPVDTLLNEIACGDVRVRGVKVFVPPSRFNAVIRRLDEVTHDDVAHLWQLCWFLAQKCDRAFLESFIEQCPKFLQRLRVWSNIRHSPEVALLIRLKKLRLLHERNRRRAVKQIGHRAVTGPDGGFLSRHVRSLFSRNEMDELLRAIRGEVISGLPDIIEDWRSQFSHDDGDPESYFEDLIDVLNLFHDEFEKDCAAINMIEKAIAAIEEVVEQLREDIPPEREDHDTDFGARKSEEQARSIFDDVDQ